MKTRQQEWMSSRDGAYVRKSTSGKSLAGLSVFTAIWTVFSVALVMLAWGELAPSRKPETLLIFVFPGVGIVLLLFWIRALLQWTRFGRSVIQVRQPPILGAVFEGEVVIPSAVHFLEAPELTLECTRIEQHRSGGKTQSRRILLWQERVRVPVDDTVTQSGCTVVPFRMVIPVDCPETDPAKRQSWRLRIQGEVPGIDVAVAFELPLVRTDASCADLTEERLTRETGLDALLKSFGSHSGIHFSRKGTSGLRMAVDTVASRNPGSAVGMVVFGAIWLGAIFLFTRIGAPVVVPVLLGIFFLLFLAILIQWLTKRTLTQLTPDGLRVECTHPLGRSSRVIPLSQISGFQFRQSGSSQSGDRVKAYYTVTASGEGLGRSGQVDLAGMIGEKDQARAIVRLFEEHLASLTGVPAPVSPPEEVE